MDYIFLLLGLVMGGIVALCITKRYVLYKIFKPGTGKKIRISYDIGGFEDPPLDNCYYYRIVSKKLKERGLGSFGRAYNNEETELTIEYWS